MRTKEEILGEYIGKELREIAEYTGFDKMEVKIRAGTLETLLDIRDILAKAYTEKEENRKRWQRQTGTGHGK